MEYVHRSIAVRAVVGSFINFNGEQKVPPNGVQCGIAIHQLDEALALEAGNDGWSVLVRDNYVNLLTVPDAMWDLTACAKPFIVVCAGKH